MRKYQPAVSPFPNTHTYTHTHTLVPPLYCLQLLDSQAVGVRREKMYRLDDHIACAVAGITADANILINTCRLQAQRYLFTYQVRPCAAVC